MEELNPKIIVLIATNESYHNYLFFNFFLCVFLSSN